MTITRHQHLTKTTATLIFLTVFTVSSWANILPSPEEPANAGQTPQAASTNAPSPELSTKELAQKLLSIPVDTFNDAVEKMCTQLPASISLEIKKLPKEKQRLWGLLFSFRVMTEAPAPSKLPDLNSLLNSLLKRQQSIIDVTNHTNTSSTLKLALFGTSSIAFGSSLYMAFQIQLGMNLPTLTTVFTGLSCLVSIFSLMQKPSHDNMSEITTLLSDYTKDTNKLFREMTQIIKDKESKLNDTYALAIAPSVLEFVQKNSVETLHQEFELILEKMQKQYFAK
jgi:hypothetical protein